MALTCQWIGPEKDPITTPREELFSCCERTLPGKSYCEAHYNRVYMRGTALRTGRAINKLIVNDPYSQPATIKDEEPKELEFTV